MAKNSIDAYGAKGKTNLLTFDPADLVLVTDKDHHLYDERVHLPVTEAMVLNVMHYGVLEPIIIAKNPETGAVEVVAGRQRVKACREANQRLVAQGDQPHRIPAMPRSDKPGHMLGIIATENELREADTPLGRADKMQRMQSKGYTDADLALAFGCTVQTVRATLSLLTCCADVRKAVQAGAINVGHAQALVKLTPDEQRTKLAELVAAGEGARPHEKARRQREIVGGADRPRMRTRKEVLAMRDTHEAGPWREALGWVLGLPS